MFHEMNIVFRAAQTPHARLGQLELAPAGAKPANWRHNCQRTNGSTNNLSACVNTEVTPAFQFGYLPRFVGTTLQVVLQELGKLFQLLNNVQTAF
jgi:hypothetical protein